MKCRLSTACYLFQLVWPKPKSLRCSKRRKALISLALSETCWWIPESGPSLNLLTRYGKAINTRYSVGSVVPSSIESQRGGRVCLSVSVSHMCLSVDICVCRGQRTISEDNRVLSPHCPLYLSPCLSAVSLPCTSSELPIILLTPPPISQQGHTGMFWVSELRSSCPGWSRLKLLSSSHYYTSAFYSEDYTHTAMPDFRSIPNDA